MRAHLKTPALTGEERVTDELADVIQAQLGYNPDIDLLRPLVDEMLPDMQMSKPGEQWHVYAAAIFAAFEGEFRAQHRWVPGAHRGAGGESE